MEKVCYNNFMKILVYSDVHGNKYALEKLQNRASEEPRKGVGNCVY